jgi:hypothetical protein
VTEEIADHMQRFLDESVSWQQQGNVEWPYARANKARALSATNRVIASSLLWRRVPTGGTRRA